MTGSSGGNGDGSKGSGELKLRPLLKEQTTADALNLWLYDYNYIDYRGC